MIARRPAGASERAQPLRIALSLMDRWEIGGPVVAELFLPLMRSVEDFANSQSSPEAVDLVLRSASIFFDGVESGLIWSRILQLVNNADQEDLRLANFIITTFNIREEEMLRVHMPMVTLALLYILRDSEPKLWTEATRSSTHYDQAPQMQMITLIELIVPLIPESAFGNDFLTKSTSETSLDTLKAIRDFYTEAGGSLVLPQLPFTPSELGVLILQQTASLFSSYLDNGDDLLDKMASIVVMVASKVADPGIHAEIADKVLGRMVSGRPLTHFSLLSAISSVALSVCTSNEYLATVVPVLVE